MEKDAASLLGGTLLEQVQQLPKVELHRHMEGSVRLETLVEIARDHDREINHITSDQLRPHVQMVPGQEFSASVFLSKFKVLRQFYNSPQTIRRIAQEAVLDAVADNIKYLELRFTPSALCNVLACAYHQVMDWVCDAVQQTAAQHDIIVRLIVSMNRHEGVGVAEEVLDVALAYQNRGVVGIDLAGDETRYSCAPFADVFRRARTQDLFTTVHAGEWSGADSIGEAVRLLNAQRIGHGIRAIESDNVVNMLVANDIALEVCPTSNVHSGVAPSLRQHPLEPLFRSGVKTTINTDDPLISNVTLTSEILDTMFEMRFTLAEIKQQMLNAVDSAFLPASERDALRRRFERWYSE